MKQLRKTLKASIEGGLGVLPRRKSAGNRLIVAYHNIIPANSPALGDTSLHLPESEFERQLSILQEEGDIVPLDVVLSVSDRESSLIAITFDDAYSGCLALGVQRCIPLNLPTTVFVAPGLLGRLPLWDVRSAINQWTAADRDKHLWTQRGTPAWDEGSNDVLGPKTSLYRIGTESDLRDTVRSELVTLGSHTFSHANLGALSTQAAIGEIEDSYSWLAARFPYRTSAALAYPYGIPPRNADEVLACTSVSHGLCVAGGWFTASQVKRAVVPRLNVPGQLSASGFRARVRGWMGR